MVSTYSRNPLADSYPNFDFTEPMVQPLSRSVVMNRNKQALQVAGEHAFVADWLPPTSAATAAHNSYLQLDSARAVPGHEIDRAVPQAPPSSAFPTPASASSGTAASSSFLPSSLPSLPSLSVPSMPSLPSLSVPSLSSLNPMSWGKGDAAAASAAPDASKEQSESFFKRMTPPNLAALNPMSWGMFSGSSGNSGSDGSQQQQPPSLFQRLSPNNLSSLNPMSWGQAADVVSPAPESSAAPIPAHAHAASAEAFDTSSVVVAHSISVREMAAKFDTVTAQPAVTVTASVVHHDIPDQALQTNETSSFSAPQDAHVYGVRSSAHSELPAAAQSAQIPVASDSSACAVHQDTTRHETPSPLDASKPLSLPQTIIQEIMLEDPLIPTYTPPEVVISPPPFSRSDVNNVDPRGLTFCFLAGEHIHGMIKKRLLKIDCFDHTVALYHLGGKQKIWSFHFSQLRGVDGSEEWDETLAADSVVLLPNAGLKVVVLMCYPVDSIALRSWLNSELAAFKNSKADENAPTRTVHGLRCLLHEGKAFAGSSTMAWNSRVLSVYCGRAYVLNNFSENIPCDVIDLLGCRVEVSSQKPCQLILHAAIKHTFTFSSPKVRDVFSNAIKQAKTMYETCVTQYSEYCRGMRLLVEQNLMYAIDVKRTVFREHLRVAKSVQSAQVEPKTSSQSAHAPLEAIAHPHQISSHNGHIASINDHSASGNAHCAPDSRQAPDHSSKDLNAQRDPSIVEVASAVATTATLTTMGHSSVGASNFPQHIQASGPAQYDQASNLSSASSADEHNMRLRLSQKYEIMRNAELGAPKPRPQSKQPSANVSSSAPFGIEQQHSLRSVSDFPVNPSTPSVHSDDHGNFVTIVPHLVVSVDHVSLDLLAADILSTYGHSCKLYLFAADDVSDLHLKLPVQHNSSFIFDQNHPPSLASMCMSVCPAPFVHNYFNSDVFPAGLLLTLLRSWPRVRTTL